MESKNHRGQIILVYAALAAVTFAAYWQVTGFGLTQYDDDDYVGQNQIVQQGLTLRGLKWALTTTQFSYVHPLTCLSHMLDCQLFGMNIGLHHFTSLLLHIANSALVLAIWLRLTGALWRSAFVAALFALHPLHVESVAWIAERKDVLSTFFWLLSLWAYARYAQQSESGSPAPEIGNQRAQMSPASWARGFSARGFYRLALLLFAFGLMSKPMVITLPCVFLLMDFWPLKRIELSNLNSQFSILRRLFLEKLPFFALAGAATVITVVAMRSLGHIASSTVVPWGLRFTNIPVSYVRYLLKLFWPDQLAVFYPMPAQWPVWQVAASSVLLIALSVMVWKTARRRPYLLFGWVWFLGTLVPAIGLLPVAWHSMADRYTYIPSIGLFVMVAWGAVDLLPRWAAKRSVLGATAVALLAACAIKTWAQTQHWRNVKTLFANAVASTKNNAIAHYNLGCALLAEGDATSAQAQFETAVRINPRHDSAHNNLGRLLYLQGDKVLAIKHLREAVRLNPAMDNAHFNLGLALMASGLNAEAVSHLAAAVRLSPIYGELHAELGALLVRQGRPADAISCYRRALRHCPDAPLLLNNLAWLLATNEHEELRDGDEAVRLARKACQLTGFRVAVTLGTLAAAYAEIGQFEEAVSSGEQARALALETGQQELAERNARLVELYRTRRPYREVTSHASRPADVQNQEP